MTCVRIKVIDKQGGALYALHNISTKVFGMKNIVGTLIPIIIYIVGIRPGGVGG